MPLDCQSAFFRVQRWRNPLNAIIFGKKPKDELLSVLFMLVTTTRVELPWIPIDFPWIPVDGKSISIDGNPWEWHGGRWESILIHWKSILIDGDPWELNPGNQLHLKSHFIIAGSPENLNPEEDWEEAFNSTLLSSNSIIKLFTGSYFSFITFGFQRLNCHFRYFHSFRCIPDRVDGFTEAFVYYFPPAKTFNN